MSEIIRTPQEWKQSLLDNVADVTLKQLEFKSVDDCVDIGAYKGSPAYNIRGSGGNFTWDGSAVYRLFHEPNPASPAPLIRFPADRSWELRISGVIFHGMANRGMMLSVEQAQQSRYEDLRFQDCGDGSGEPQEAPFRINGGSATWDYLQLFWNRAPGVIFGAGVCKVRDLHSVADWGGPLRAGLRLVAPPHAPPPMGNSLATALWIEEPHIEGSPLIIDGYDHGAELRGGYYLAAGVDWLRCRHGWANITAWNASWYKSALYRDGVGVSLPPGGLRW